MQKLLSKRLLVATVVASVYGAAIPAALVSSDASAQQKASEKQTRKVPTLRSKVYDQLSRAQTAADEGNVGEAIDILDVVKSKTSSMNSYEQAMMYNFYGFIYYNDEQYDKALDAFASVVEQQPIPRKFEMSTLFSLAQLHLMQGNYENVVKYLERWETLNNGEIPPKNKVLKAQALYQNKQYEDAAGYIDQAVAEHEAQGMIPDEGWLVLQRAVYYELKRPEKVKDILVKMVKLYNEPKYWIQLAGMYGELGEERKQLAIMETAYQQGYVQSAADIFNLAQLYYYHRAPFKGAKLMEQALADGTLEKNLRNWRFLGQTWQLAKENDKAIPALTEAAALSEDGELDSQLAQIYLNTEKWDKAIAAAERALEKGQLRNEGTPHLVKGMALYNTGQYARALDQLAEAEKHPKSRGIAQQWKKFVEAEKSSQERREIELSS